jgi:hypothetical protein
MQASSCTVTNFRMFTLQNKKANRSIGANDDKSVESKSRYCDSVKRKKIDTTDWTSRPVGEQGNLSDNCVFTRARLSQRIPELDRADKVSHILASNHRYGPVPASVVHGPVRRHDRVLGRAAEAERLAGSIRQSG